MAQRQAGTSASDAMDTDGEHHCVITPLGAGQEVGRSCIILKYRGKTVMLDCGIHPGYSGMKSLPYLDEVDLSKVDVALITHFHLDHCAAVPHLVGNTDFKGKIYMTHATKAIFYLLLKDFVKVSKNSADEALYSERHLEAAMERIHLIDFHQTIDIDGIKVTAYRAGHVLGAAMFMVEIGGMRCLYTGDYSRIKDRHLDAAELPEEKPHIVIVESTYGTSNHLHREAREALFLERVTSTLRAGGHILLPVVALGRAQELLLMMEEHWRKTPELQGVPIYQVSGLARKALTIFQTYIESLNQDIRDAFQLEMEAGKNPFNFKYVKHMAPGQLDDVGPCVVMATPSMLQSGLSRELFEAWCEDARNTVLICDFAVQGTLARELQDNPSHVMTRQGLKVPLRMAVHHISFSAHADFEQTSGFLDALQPPHVVLVHGEATGMKRLREALLKTAAATNIPREVYMPGVTQPVQIKFSLQHAATMEGRLAVKPLREGQAVRGLLIKRGFDHVLLHPQDLPHYTKIVPGRITHKQALALTKPFMDVRLALEVMFEGVEGHGHLPVSSTGGSPQGEEEICVAGLVTITHKRGDAARGVEEHVLVQWEGGSVGDMVADAVVAVILQASGEPLAVGQAEEARRRAISSNDSEGAAQAELQLVAALMGAQFGPSRVDADMGQVFVEVDGVEVVVDHYGNTVLCEDPGLQGRVERALLRLQQAMGPCSMDFDE